MGDGKRPRRGVPIELLLLVGGVLGLVVALLTQLSSTKLISLSNWQMIFLSVIATAVAAGGAVLTWRKEQRSRVTQRTNQLIANLAVAANQRRVELPSVADVDPYVLCGVSASNYDPRHRNHDPYLRRAGVDDLVDRALGDQDFVLLVGKSAAGKTRTAFEAVRRVLPGARLLIPQVRTPALTELMGLDPPLRVGEAPVVIWLDDLERYLRAGTVDVSLLNRVRKLAARVVILATIRSDQQELLLATTDATGRAARQLLDQARTIVVHSELTDDEKAEAERLYPEETFERGIGEQLIAAPDLESRYRNGFLSDRVANRVGWALVQAAIDWHRVGMSRAITQAQQVALCRIYLPRRGRAANPDSTSWAAALEWAVEAPENAPVALLEEERTDDGVRSFRPFDYIVSYVDGTPDGIPREIPEDVWEFALGASNGSEKTWVALTAESRGRADMAERGYRAVQENVESVEPSVVSVAGLMHGMRLSERGDDQGALDAFESGLRDTKGDPSIMALIQFNRATVLSKRGDRAGAQQAYRAAMALKEPDTTLLSALNLGGMLQNEGDLVGVKAVYEEAGTVVLGRHEIMVQFSTLVAQLMHDRGVVMASLSDHEAAMSDFRGAILAADLASASNDASAGANRVRASAELRLGMLLCQRGQPGDRNEAIKLLRSAQGSDDMKVAAGAGLQLGWMVDGDDQWAAEAAYRQAAAAGDPGISPLAWYSLGKLLDRRGDLAGAVRAYEHAMVSHSPTAGMAAFDLGRLRTREGNLQAARDAYRVAAGFPGSESGQNAMFELATTLMELHETDEAEAVARQLIRAGNPDVTPRAAVVLGLLLRERGDLSGAEAAYRQAVATGHPHSMAAAQFNLGVLQESRGDLDGALTAYQEAIDSGDRAASPMAAYNAGVLMERLQQWDAARTFFGLAAASGHLRVAPMAAEALRSLSAD